MIGTVIVGVMISLMFLISFSEWFYHLAAGIDEVLVRDVYVYYRLALWIGGSLLFMLMIFWILSLTYECPRFRERKGVFKYLNCNAYWQVRGRVEGRSPEGIKRELLEKKFEQREEELEKWM